MMMTSSSSAYGSSFHDNGDGNDNKKILFTPGKRKSTHDGDDGGDGNDNGAPKDDQEAKMTPKPPRTDAKHGVGTRHHGTTSWSDRSCSRYYKPIILNTY
jgi:hypothetical protein